MIEGNVLITGGTGSLGRALLRRIHDEAWDCNVTVFSRDETKQSHTRAEFPNVRYMLGDVAKVNDVRRVMRGQDVVFHFAAYKQVPASQNNVVSTIETNVIGSRNIIESAIDFGVKQVVASSTDKAAAPANAYGASKELMEYLFQNANLDQDVTTFHLARYGNVVCSNASVIPLFIKQAAGGGPLTVTHRDMTRFWITLDNAVDLILQALNAPPGHVVVPKAKALSVWHLAELIGGDLPIKEVGIRPGEKVHEVMVTPAESFYTEVHSDHFVIHPPYSGNRLCETHWVYSSVHADQVSDWQMRKWIEEYS